MRDGHLHRDGARLRVWGVNLQAGTFKSYEEVDRLIERCRALGFNALRVWPVTGTFYAPSNGPAMKPRIARKGDGSDQDRFDYLIAKASQAGMVVQMTMLHYMDLPMLRTLRDSPLASLVQSASSEQELRTLSGMAPYVSGPYRAAMKDHIARMLERVNPYTHRRYADEPAVLAWELGNEGRFVECALSSSCLQGLPAVFRSQLLDSWVAEPDHPRDASLEVVAGKVAGPHYAAYSRFIATTFQRVSEELRDHARTIGGPDSAIARQPFIFNTGPVSTSGLGHYAYSRGDIFSIGVYSSPLRARGLDGTAWMPTTSGGPLPPGTVTMKVKDKPLVVYETSFFRPFPFRAEWGPLMAAIALQQDWDGAFLYQYGQPAIIYTQAGKPEGYGTVPLSEPVARDVGAGDYTVGFHHGSDPVAIGSWSAAGRLFTSVRETVPPANVWRIPMAALFSEPSGYPTGTLARLAEAAMHGPTVVEFDSGSAPHCAPCALPASAAKSFTVAWPVAGAPLIVTAPGGVLYAGKLVEGQTKALVKGIQFTPRTTAFGLVAGLQDAVAGQPDGTVATVVVLGDVRNSASQFDAARVDFSSPAGAMAGLRAKGGLPLLYDGPMVDLAIGMEAEVIDQDFGLQSSPAKRVGTAVPYGTPGRVFRKFIVR